MHSSSTCVKNYSIGTTPKHTRILSEDIENEQDTQASTVETCADQSGGWLQLLVSYL